MKKLRSFLIVGGITLFVAIMTFCIVYFVLNQNKLKTPTNLNINEETLELTWDSNEYADGFIVLVNDKEYECRRSSFTGLEDLEEGEYSIKVKAIGDQIDYKDSDWSKVKTFKKEKEALVEYQLTVDKKAYEVVAKGRASGNIEIDAEYRGKPVIGIADMAFANVRGIKSVVLPDSIKYVGKRAFSSCMDLVSVNLPEDLETLGERAFQGCSVLKSINIPKNITVIEQYMFAYCRELATVEMNDSITEIAYKAFSDCEALTEIKLPSTVKTLGEASFSNCLNVETIDLGGNVETIGENSFYNCKKVTEIKLGDKLTNLGGYCFYNCKELTEIEIPNTVKEIPSYSFYGCEKLEKVDFAEDITKIGENSFTNTKIWNDSEELVYCNNWLVGVKEDSVDRVSYDIDEQTIGIGAEAFRSCKNLSAILIPNSVKYIGDSAFYSCSKLMGVEIGNEDITDGQGIVSIGTWAFAYCKALYTVNIFGEELEVIDNYAFYGCEFLPELKIPNSVKRVGMYAFNATRMWNNSPAVVYLDRKWVVGFKEDRGEYSTQISNGVIGISDCAFYDCTALQEVILPDSLRYIGTLAFYQCESLKKISIPAGVEEIADYTFFKCKELKEVELSNTITKIGRSAFFNCVSLKSIRIPSSVEEIVDYAFYSCITLNTVVIEEGVEIIGTRVFQGCSQLLQVDIPDSVTKLGTHAFYNCTALNSVSLGTGIDKIDNYTFFACSSLERIIIPDNVTYVGKSAFRKCSSLGTIILAEGLKEIDDFAFYECAALNLKLPQSLKRVGNYALRNIETLKTLILHEGIEDFGKHAIYGCKNLTIFVDKDVDDTGWASNWNSYYRPVIFNVTLSEDNSYVVSIVAGENVVNHDALNGMNAPERTGYTFKGWATTENGAVVYSMSQLSEVANGTTLYAVWNQDR